jgi:hypothetical protein
MKKTDFYTTALYYEDKLLMQRFLHSWVHMELGTTYLYRCNVSFSIDSDKIASGLIETIG